MYAEGLGVTKDLVEAIRLYEEAASAGEFFTQIELARILSRGLGLPPDPEAARKWYSAAAAAEGKIDPAALDLLHDCFCTRYCSPSAVAFAADMYAILDAVSLSREDTDAPMAAFPEHFAVPRIGTSVAIALLNDLHTIF